MVAQLTLDDKHIEMLNFKSEQGRIVTNAECGPTPPGEVVVRSAFCNLRCIPCFAFSYSWPEKAKDNKNIVKVTLDKLLKEFQGFLRDSPIPGKKDSFNWFRILGGEPFLNQKTLKDYIHFLQEIAESESRLFNNSVLIQTNGITLGQIDKSELLKIFEPLKKKSFKVVVEMSIKGSNPEEFAMITQTESKIAHAFYKWHIVACENMEYIHSQISNVDWTAVAGFGIGVTNLVAGNLDRKEYIKTFYHPKINKPFYHPNCWDELFINLHNLHLRKYENKFGKKFPMFGIEDRYNWKFALSGLRNCKKYASGYFYDGYEVYKKQNALKNEELEKYILNIIETFFFGDPTYYYTKLFT